LLPLARAGLCALICFHATVLMGATLPILAACWIAVNGRGLVTA